MLESMFMSSWTFTVHSTVCADDNYNHSVILFKELLTGFKSLCNCKQFYVCFCKYLFLFSLNLNPCFKFPCSFDKQHNFIYI